MFKFILIIMVIIIFGSFICLIIVKFILFVGFKLIFMSDKSVFKI